MKKIILLILTILMSFLLVGCGKFGEDKSISFVKEHLYMPDSFEKVSYDANENSYVGRLEFKAKTVGGLKIQQVFYLNLKNNNIEVIDTKKLPDDKVKFLFERKTDNFINMLEEYKKASDLEKNVKYAENTITNIYEETHPDNHKNGSSTNSRYNKYAQQAKKCNKILKDYRDMYSTIDKNIKQILLKPSDEEKYLKVTSNFKNSKTEYTKKVEDQVYYNFNGFRVDENFSRIDGVDGKAPYQGKELEGKYIGSYVIDGIKRGLKLSIFQDDGIYKAIFEFYQLDGEEKSEEGSYKCYVAYYFYNYDLAEQYVVRGYEWIAQPKNYKMVQLVGRINDGVFKGIIPRMGTFELKKVSN